MKRIELVEAKKLKMGGYSASINGDREHGVFSNDSPDDAIGRVLRRDGHKYGLRILLTNEERVKSQRAEFIVVRNEPMGDGFQGFINGIPSTWESGKTIDQAIGATVRVKGNEFGIQVALT